MSNSQNTFIRPWGDFNIITENSTSTLSYKLKQLNVKSGKRLSLQSHKYRSEHWIIIQGIAKIIIGEEEYIRVNNEYIFIPIGEKHRIENVGEDDLIIIETQIGSYLGEDDIIRYEDDYNRY